MNTEQDVQLSPLALAYVGDAVYSLAVRMHFMGIGLKLQKVHLETTKLVQASAQAENLRRILPMLTDEELDVVRRGRNAHARHPGPKSATCAEYAQSTAFEALIGFLHIRGRTDRLHQLIGLTWKEDAPNA